MAYKVILNDMIGGKVEDTGDGNPKDIKKGDWVVAPHDGGFFGLVYGKPGKVIGVGYQAEYYTVKTGFMKREYRERRHKTVIVQDNWGVKKYLAKDVSKVVDPTLLQGGTKL